MLTKLNRLMAPEDSSPGGGSPAPSAADGTPAPAATPAQGTAPTVDTAALAREVAATVRDSIFAELRKSGVVGKKAEPAATTEAPPNGHAIAPASSAADIEALLERRENFAHALGKFDVPDTALVRARKAFSAEKPDDVADWVKTFATDMGWKQRTAQPAPAGSPAATTTTATTSTPHVTERPGPPAAHVVTDDTPLRSMSPSDREAYRQKVGDIKFADRYLKELRDGNVMVKTRQ